MIIKGLLSLMSTQAKYHISIHNTLNIEQWLCLLHESLHVCCNVRSESVGFADTFPTVGEILTHKNLNKRNINSQKFMRSMNSCELILQQMFLCMHVDRTIKDK